MIDMLGKFLHAATGKVKKAADLKVGRGFGVLSIPFVHSGADRVEEPLL